MTPEFELVARMTESLGWRLFVLIIVLVLRRLHRTDAPQPAAEQGQGWSVRGRVGPDGLGDRDRADSGH